MWPSGAGIAKMRAPEGSEDSAESKRSSAAPSQKSAAPSGETRSSTSQPPQRPRAATEPVESRRTKKPGRGASARYAESDSKRRGFSGWGPPGFGRERRQVSPSV